MGLRNLAESSVKKAFNAVKDLALDVVLTNSAATGYDFATAEAVMSATTTRPVKGILIEKKQGRGRASAEGVQTGSSVSLQMLFKATDVPEPSIYDTITTSDNRVWRMVPPYTNDGFLVTVSLAKEV